MTKEIFKNLNKSRIWRFFDVGQQKGLFSHTVCKNPLPNEKIAIPLHRQKEIKSLMTQDNTLLK